MATAVKKKKPAAPKSTPGGDVYDRLEKQLAENQRGQGAYWSPQLGKSMVRLFPFDTPDGPTVFVKECSHFAVDEANPNRSVTCPGEDCPICEAVRDEEIGSRCRLSVKYLCNGIVRDIDSTGEDVQRIIRLPKTAYERLSQLMSKAERTARNLGDPLSLTKGRDFQIVRSGVKLKTKYDAMPAATATPIGMDVNPVDLVTKLRAAPSEEELGLMVKKLKKAGARHSDDSE